MPPKFKDEKWTTLVASVHILQNAKTAYLEKRTELSNCMDDNMVGKLKKERDEAKKAYKTAMGTVEVNVDQLPGDKQILLEQGDDVEALFYVYRCGKWRVFQYQSFSKATGVWWKTIQARLRVGPFDADYLPKIAVFTARNSPSDDDTDYSEDEHLELTQGKCKANGNTSSNSSS